MKEWKEKYYLERISELEDEIIDLESENSSYMACYDSIIKGRSVLRKKNNDLNDRLIETFKLMKNEKEASK